MTEVQIKSGQLIYGFPFDSYAGMPCMNATVLKAGRISMRHMRHAATTGHDDTASLAFGRIAHQTVLENGLSADLFAVWSDGRRAGNKFESFKASADADNKTVITANERDELTALVAAVHSNPLAHQIISETKHEASCLWDADLGPAKCRFDGISDDWYLEWKSTAKRTGREFQSQSYSLGYHIAFAHYLDGAHACGLRPKLRVISTESSAPFDTVVYEVDPRLMDIGRSDRERIWRTYIECGKTGVYPGAGVGLQVLAAPEWAMESGDVEIE